MSQSGRKPFVGTLLGRKHGISARADIEWERIMVQITFAFVIILGYLLSVGMSEAKQLAAESEKYREISAHRESIIKELRQTEVGEEREKRVVAERDLQLQKLLTAWDSVCRGRPLFRMLIQFGNAEQVELSDDLESLPEGQNFELLKSEVDRVFLSEGEKVAGAEVTALMESVIVEAGFDLNAIEEGFKGDALPQDVRELTLDESVFLRQNCDTLALKILGDLTRERENLVDVQFALVRKIAVARLTRLGPLPLEAGDDLDIEVSDGKVMLETILEELGSTVKLLPETAARFRVFDEPSVDAAQE